jgi:hypothetical protein
MFGRLIFAGNGPPVLVSLSIDLGDTLGGDTVVLTGRCFTAATSVTFAGTNAASFTVDSSTQITAVTPAHVAATGDVVVTTPLGTSTLTSAFEFWSPAELAPSSFWDGGSYTAAPGFWASRSTSSGTVHEWRESTYYPDAVGGVPSFVRANADVLSGFLHTGPTLSWGATIGTGSCTILIVFDLLDIATNQPTAFDNEALVVDTNAYAGLFVKSTGAVIFNYEDPADRSVSVTLSPVTGTKIVAAKKDAGTLYMRQSQSGGWTAGSAAGVLLNSVLPLQLGLNSYPSPDRYINGKVKALVLDDVAWSDADVVKFYKWASTRHP